MTQTINNDRIPLSTTNLNSMMYGNNWFAMGLGLHMFFGLLLGLGVLFLIIWAFKFADKKTLKKTVTWLLLLGVLGSILTAMLGTMFFDKDGRGFGYMMNFDKNSSVVKCRDLTSVETKTPVAPTTPTTETAATK